MHNMTMNTIQETSIKLKSLNDQSTEIINRINKLEFALLSQRTVNDSFANIMKTLDSSSTEVRQKLDYVRNVLWKYRDDIDHCESTIKKLENALSEFDKITCKNQRRRNWMRGKKRRR